MSLEFESHLSQFEIYNFHFFLMKNSLELQITTLIKKANKAYTKKEYSQSLELYDKALQVFHQNKTYNSEVSPHFQALILSLKGQSNFKMEEMERAQENFNLALQITPYDSLALIRRATMYCKVNRLSEAIEDLERAQLSDPDGENLKEVFASIQENLGNLNDSDQKERLTANLKSLKDDHKQDDGEQLKQEEMLNFSKLKRIDRISFSSHSNRATNKLSSFQIEYENDRVEQVSDKFMSEENSQSQDYTEENPVQIIQKKNGKKKPGSTNLKKLMSLNEGSDPVKAQTLKRLLTSTESYKSIDGNLERRSSVRFIDNNRKVPCSSDTFDKNSLESNQKPEKRKSCLRISKIVQASQGLKRKTSSFLDIKNIDGPFIPSSFCNMKEESSPKKQEANSSENANEFSDSQDQNNEHNVYGQKYRTSKILKCIQNLNNWSVKKINNKMQKKKSILKKNSMIGSQRQTFVELKTIQNKKSVCFQDQNFLIKQN